MSCRTEVSVPSSFAEGDIIRCPSCGTSHRVHRGGGGVRLVIADVAPLREALRVNQALVQKLESELSRARAHFGIGANGLGLGVLYVVVQVGLEEKLLTPELFRNAIAIALLSGMGLELVNFLFLAKRQAISRLTREIEEARAEGRQIQQRIREGTRR